MFTISICIGYHYFYFCIYCYFSLFWFTIIPSIAVCVHPLTYSLSPRQEAVGLHGWFAASRWWSFSRSLPNHVVCLALQCLHRLQCLCARSISPFFCVPPAVCLGPHNRHTVVYLPFLCCFYLCKYLTTWSQLMLFLYLTINKVCIYLFTSQPYMCRTCVAKVWVN